MTKFRRTVALPAFLLAAGCERSRNAPAIDSSVARPAGTADTVAVGGAKSWDPSAGPLLLVAGETPADAIVVTPDSSAASATLSGLPNPASVTLFSRSGTVQSAELPGVVDSGSCVRAILSAAPPPRPWNVGFIGGAISPITTDSIESVGAADSTALVVWMNRLASTLPNDSAGRFSGLPFVVRALWRFRIPDGPVVAVGNLERQINQEATPLQERTFLVAERSMKDSSYAVAYSERSYGLEETIQGRELLATALLGSSRHAALVVARDFGDAIAYGMIERGDDGVWRARWSSARQHCSD